MITNRKVSFSNANELRTFIVEENEEVKYFDGLIDVDSNVQCIEDNPGQDNFQEISFEETEHKFLIEDNFYKHPYKFPKKVADIKWIKQLPKEELNKYAENLETAINIAGEKVKNMFYRIDGIIIFESNKELILLTEFYIFDYLFVKEKYEFNRIIEIKLIDFITLTRDGNSMILHMVPIYKNNENINKNFILMQQRLERVVACICSSNFYDMPTGQKLEHLNRRISVIFIDENFEVFETLQSVTSFDEYKYNIFLIIHLDQF
jgi:hypothetical protein